MKVKEYLVGRILKLEEELKQARNEKAGTTYGLQKLEEDVIKLKEKIEQYEIEREHIKEIITCNIVEALHCPGRYEIDLNSTENDFKTLMAILDIKPRDYRAEDVEAGCDKCIFQDVDANTHPCNSCDMNSEFIEKEDKNAETTD